MSLNPTFDDVLGYVFKTLDTVYQLHAPEDPENEDASNCVQCGVKFPCPTEEAILGGLAEISLVMEAARDASASEEEPLA